MRILNGEDEHEILAVDTENSVLGKGYIYEFPEADLHSKRKMNYFIEVVACVDDSSFQIRDYIVNELIAIAKEQRKKYPEWNARVYNCCFAEDTEKIEYFKRIDGFKADEGMHILVHDLKQINNCKPIDNKFIVKEDTLNTLEGMNELINEHKKIFFKSAYTVEKIQQLQENDGFKNIAIYCNGAIVANIILFIDEEDGIKYGLVEDLFVVKNYRNRGLGEYLVLDGLNYFKKLGLNESRLEVWSANERAPQLYYKVGYKLFKETEVSIGMSI